MVTAPGFWKENFVGSFGKFGGKFFFLVYVFRAVVTISVKL